MSPRAQESPEALRSPTAGQAPEAPDATVVVIVYNDAGRLPRAVASVRRQTHANIEIVISDDHSTDATPEVARRLAAEDPRILHLRLDRNSGGCSVPRNRALEIARAPYVMFLDSDDELPPNAVELLLAAHREQDVDFVMGAVERVRADTGNRGRWMPHLVAERRTVHGIDAEPRLFFEHLATSKMYARAFLDRHGLRFPEGIHYEDQLFTAQAYCLARAFTVVPEPVYRWYIAPHASADTASISNQRHKLDNVRDRVHVQRLVDDFLTESGHGGLHEEKDYKFLKHDFRMYAGDLPDRDEEWLTEFAEIVNPYLATLTPGAYARLPRPERVVLQLVRELRLADARLAARGLGHGVGPRTVVTDEDGRTYWGDRVPDSEWARRELDLSELAPDTCPSPTPCCATRSPRSRPAPAPRWTWRSARTTPRCASPSARRPRPCCSPRRRRMTVPFRLSPVGPGVYEGHVHVDLAAAPIPLHGFDGARHPVLRLKHQGMFHQGVLLAPETAFRPLTARVEYHSGAAPHQVTVEPEERGTGRLQVRWRPSGVTARVVRPVVRRMARPRVRRAARLLASALR
ncbi:Transferase OS=Streptomyces glaucescens OX=1907 GN=SGLAU_13605 PE=4 SV=1 [Streptomyces glaucescens]